MGKGEEEERGEGKENFFWCVVVGCVVAGRLILFNFFFFSQHTFFIHFNILHFVHHFSSNFLPSQIPIRPKPQDIFRCSLVGNEGEEKMGREEGE